MITDGYKELPDSPYDNLPITLYFMWHAPLFPSILSHWHNRMEILYVIDGSLNVTCGNFSGVVKENEVVVVNPNQLHAAISGEKGVHYYAIVFDSNLLDCGAKDWCTEKYLHPIFSKSIQFRNHIQNAEICSILLDIVKEYFDRLPAYELSIKANTLKLISILYRNYINMSEETIVSNNDFACVIDYINENFNSRSDN